MKRTLLLTIFIVLLITALTYQQTVQLRAFRALNDKTAELAAQALALSTELETYKTLPDWLVDAYVKCNVKQVPQNFRRACVAYELKGY